tara:strand:- start:3051 stop:4121 length:1071 start_codon:yes stop_codon:yes gene_type:complete
MSKKIFFIIPDLRCGGAEKVFINLANFYSDQFDVRLILLEKKGELLNQLNNNIKVVSLETKRIRNSFFKLIPILKDVKNSYIISAMWPLNCFVMLASLFLSKSNKFFVTEHVNLSKSIGIDFKSKKLMIYLSISLTYFLSEKVICVSNGVAKDIQKYYLFGKDKFMTIYNPIINKVSEINRTDNLKINILSVGTLKMQKDHLTLLKAFSLLENIDLYHLNIVGDGPLMLDLKNYSRELGLLKHVTFHGFQNNVDKFYKSNDIFILSSIYEGFGNVLVEALSFGMQIISTNCQSGPSEILDNGKYGILVPIKKPEKIRNAITKIMSSKFNPKDLKARSNDFKIDTIAKKYLNLMQAS